MDFVIAVVMHRANESRGTDRISIDDDMHQLYKDLTEKSNDNPEECPFIYMKDLFMWAVAWGVKVGKRTTLKKREPVFRWDQLSQHADIPMLQAIAISETKGLEVLLDEGQILRIAEEYANTGIRELKREVIDQPGNPLWNLVATLRREAVSE